MRTTATGPVYETAQWKSYYFYLTKQRKAKGKQGKITPINNKIVLRKPIKVMMMMMMMILNLFTCLLNSQKANYKVNTSKE
jgi:hypothetical protein